MPSPHGPGGPPSSAPPASCPLPPSRSGPLASPSGRVASFGEPASPRPVPASSPRSVPSGSGTGARLGLGTLLDDPRLGEEALFRPFQEDAEKWFRAKCEELASTVGGGVCSAGVTSIVRTAAWERAFSAYLFELAITKAFGWDRGTDKAGKPTLDPRLDLASLASKLGDSSRQNLLAAHELCAREAAARKSAPSTATTSAFVSKYEEVLKREAEAYQSARKALEAQIVVRLERFLGASFVDVRARAAITRRHGRGFRVARGRGRFVAHVPPWRLSRREQTNRRLAARDVNATVLPTRAAETSS